jgi:putative addiction module CopG family antidote
MPSETHVVSLRPEQAAFVKSVVTSGGYESVDEVVDAALCALQAQDELTAWLKNDVAPVVDEINANPGLGLTPDQVKSDLLAHHLARIASDAA